MTQNNRSILEVFDARFRPIHPSSEHIESNAHLVASCRII